jgi:hypothetical protein
MDETNHVSVEVYDYVFERDERGIVTPADLMIISDHHIVVRRGLERWELAQVRRIVREKLGFDLVPVYSFALAG